MSEQKMEGSGLRVYGKFLSANRRARFCPAVFGCLSWAKSELFSRKIQPRKSEFSVRILFEV